MENNIIKLCFFFNLKKFHSSYGSLSYDPSIFFLRDIKPDVRCIFFSNGIKNLFDPFDIVSRIRSTILLTRSSFVDERVTTAIDSSLVLCLYTVIYGICLYTIVRSTNSKIEIYKRIKVIIITSGEFTFSR